MSEHSSDAAGQGEPVDAEIVDEDEQARTPSAPAPAATARPVLIPAAPEDVGYTASGIPTFESVREKIETRYGTSLGAAELDAETPEGRSVEEQYEARQKAAAERLEQIRASMRDESAGNG